MITLEKLTPAPWTVDAPGCVGHTFKEGGKRTIAIPGDSYNPFPPDIADAEFIALARNAFDVMMRRGWWAIKDVQGKFFVKGDCKGSKFGHQQTPHPCDDWGNPHRLQDPFTSLVEADKWYRENVEGK
jgi:hypothetical protein